MCKRLMMVCFCGLGVVVSRLVIIRVSVLVGILNRVVEVGWMF